MAQRTDCSSSAPWRAPRWVVLMGLCASLLACGGGGGNGKTVDSNDNPYGITASGPGVLSVSPLDTATLVAATPLGNLNPPYHVLPTDHVYLYFVDPWSGHQQDNDCSQRPVYAAGAGTVSLVIRTEAAGDTKVMVQMTRTFMYYYDHVLLASGIQLGSVVKAGDQIATTTGRCPSLDLGVIDLELSPPGLLNPSRYGDYGAHPASPYAYFTEPLRKLYLSKVRLREGVPFNLDGRTDFGVRGRLVGDWFHSSLATAPASVITGPEGWVKSLAFVYEWFAGQARISIGGTLSPAGLLAIAKGAPDPATVGVAQGLVIYQVTSQQGPIGDGWLLVQMLTEDRLRVEFFAAAGAAAPVAFTPAAHEYVR